MFCSKVSQVGRFHFGSTSFQPRSILAQVSYGHIFRSEITPCFSLSTRAHSEQIRLCVSVESWHKSISTLLAAPAVCPEPMAKHSAGPLFFHCFFFFPASMCFCPRMHSGRLFPAAAKVFLSFPARAQVFLPAKPCPYSTGVRSPGAYTVNAMRVCYRQGWYIAQATATTYTVGRGMFAISRRHVGPLPNNPPFAFPDLTSRESGSIFRVLFWAA